MDLSSAGTILLILLAVAAGAGLVWLGRASRSGEVETAKAAAGHAEASARDAISVAKEVDAYADARGRIQGEAADLRARIASLPPGSTARAALVRELLLRACAGEPAPGKGEPPAPRRPA